MVRENILELRQRILAAAHGAKRNPAGITLVAVTKGRTIAEIKAAIDAGVTDIGENRLQEALTKHKELCTLYSVLCTKIKWHMVGHLQTNKVKEAVKIFDLIHSVDSLHLAEELDKQAAKINKIQDVLLEVKTSPEEAKFGLKPQEAIELIPKIAQLKNVSIKGLMTIAPLVDNPEKARPYFRQLRNLLNEINGMRNTEYGLRILSMGMSDDFAVAIEEGANMVRIGRAIFDSR